MWFISVGTIHRADGDSEAALIILPMTVHRVLNAVERVNYTRITLT